MEPAARFPQQRTAPLPPAPALDAHGLKLRPATDADLPWLQALYASTREAELARVPWPAPAKAAFLAQQFALQHAHYLRHFPDAAFLALAHRDGPAGRLYLRRSAPAHLLVDIALAAAWRGRGIGAALIALCQRDAAAQQRALELHVARDNPDARRLYLRLGFADDIAGSTDTHQAMRWDRPSLPLQRYRS